MEVAPAGGGMIAVRNSKQPDGEMIIYTAAEWTAFLDGVRGGEFDDLTVSEI
ncbi:hypothetical protein Abr02nite_71570 [Paractinoplanes brasiliensis]|nr:hypothetical protein Abr02nite_71570 [Actinoplanes brasiliensis]